MSTWVNHGAVVWRPTPNGSIRIADCIGESEARLIAAAPDMLAVLISINEAKNDFERTERWHLVREVIARAKGETPPLLQRQAF